MSDTDNNAVEKSQEDRLVEALKVLLKDFPDYVTVVEVQHRTYPRTQ